MNPKLWAIEETMTILDLALAVPDLLIIGKSNSVKRKCPFNKRSVANFMYLFDHLFQKSYKSITLQFLNF